MSIVGVYLLHSYAMRRHKHDDSPLHEQEGIEGGGRDHDVVQLQEVMRGEWTLFIGPELQVRVRESFAKSIKGRRL